MPRSGLMGQRLCLTLLDIVRSRLSIPTSGSSPRVSTEVLYLTAAQRSIANSEACWGRRDIAEHSNTSILSRAYHSRLNRAKRWSTTGRANIGENKTRRDPTRARDGHGTNRGVKVLSTSASPTFGKSSSYCITKNEGGTIFIFSRSDTARPGGSSQAPVSSMPCR
ncbi:hypothetical protein EDB89DRAFT_1951112 [Lactarius sanguifluus]|nr:hypothetical protein EDB89DRAFT_1951112 [Lactarius sanguifluus]